MKQTAIAMGLLAGLFLWATSVGAQWSYTWKDTPCTNSRLSAPANASCRTTNEFSGSGNSYYQFYSYVAGEDESMIGLVATTRNGQITTFKDVVNSAGDDPISKDGRNFSAPQNAQGVQYLTFEAKGRKCVRGMRMGPLNPSGGYSSWVRGNFCAPSGQALSPEAIGAFLPRLTIR
jgi:hypothetical protein